MKINVFYIFLLCLGGISSLEAQDQLLDALNKNYSNYDLISVETELLYDKLEDRSSFHEITLSVGDNRFDLELWNSGLLSDDFRVTLASGAQHEKKPPLTMRGIVNGDAASQVSLTINDGFMYGFIKHKGMILNFEPARYHDKSVDSNLILAYYNADVKEEKHGSCGTTSHHRLKNQIKDNVQNQQRSVGDCYEVEISLAADFLMFDNYGSSTDNQIIGVLNDVGTSYDDEFADEIFFDLNDIFISDCSTCDPWTSSNSASALLDDFTDWAPDNLGSHVVATLWTDRNLNGSTIGLAWLGSACSTFSYNVCQDINGASFLRVLQSHELGHNFDATHDSSSGFIMSESVSSSTSWSSNSEDDILDFISATSFCYSSCSPNGSPPIADFDFTIISDCTPGEIDFFDNSTDATSWFWTFDGGDPSTSTEENPTVFYENPGVYNVSLEVSNNSGSDTKTENDLIEIVVGPVASFTYETFGLELILENTSIGANLDYVWEFGDGDFSFDEEPFHFYDLPGTYVVELDIENNCSFDIVEETIEIYDDPEASFTSDFQLGCVNDLFQFTDISYGNIVDRIWSFPGGTPSSSTAKSPIVKYTSPGIYGVTLEVMNPEGESTLNEIAYITITEQPTAGFSYSAVNTSVTFTNSSTDATGYYWEFGDGTNSLEQNPVHNYANPGTYNVTLEVDNSCDVATIEQTIVVYGQPNALFSSNGQTGCANTSFQFSDLSTGIVVDRIWNFPGGSPSTSTDPNPLVSYNTPGNYDVTLQVTNPSGQSTLTEASYISITPPPVTGFTFSTSNTMVTFSNNSSNATSYSWNFGDGNGSTEASPTHNYASAGSYTVELISSNMCGSTSETQTITTTLIPVAQISTVQSPSGCATYTIDFVDSSLGSPTAWNWSFPGGNPSTSNEQNPTVSYANPGKYSVSLTVSNAAGSDDMSWTDYVEVLGPPTATYEYTVVGNRLDLINTTPGSSAIWEISDGASLNGNSVAHILDANGSYLVRLEVTDDCGTDVKEFMIDVDAYPTSSFTRNNTLNSDCAPQIVEFNSTSLMATNYQWQFPGGTPSSSTEPNPVITYNTVGTFDVSLEVSNQYGTDVSSQNGSINVIDVPTVDFTSSANGPTVSFNNTSTNATTYSWDFGDGNTSTLENPMHNYAISGSYVVTFIATNECGSSEVSRVVIFDYALPIINAGFSATTGCAPLEVQITDQTSNDPISWSWQMPGGNPESSTEQNPVVSYMNPGSYTISAEITNADGSSTLEFTDIIVVNDVPTAEFEVSSESESITIVNNSVGADSYSWDFGDGQSSSEFEPTHSYAGSGEYQVTLLASNECGTVEYMQIVTIIISSTKDLEIFGQWTLSPNPTAGEVSILFENKLVDELNYELRDINGRNIQEGIFAVGMRQKNLSIAESGLYFLVLSNGDKIDVKKLIVID